MFPPPRKSKRQLLLVLPHRLLAVLSPFLKCMHQERIHFIAWLPWPEGLRFRAQDGEGLPWPGDKQRVEERQLHRQLLLGTL